MSTEPFILAVTAKDRPGIIAAITRAVFDLGGNVTELSQTVMGGYFTLILRADLPAGLAEERIERTVENADPALGLTVHARRYDPQPLFVAEAEAGVYFLTLQGADRPGLIARITGFLAERQVNIEDLYTRSDAETITMIFQIRPCDTRSAEGLQKNLAQLGRDLGVTAHLLHQDILRATSEVGAIRRLVQGGKRP